MVLRRLESQKVCNFMLIFTESNKKSIFTNGYHEVVDINHLANNYKRFLNDCTLKVCLILIFSARSQTEISTGD